MSEANSIAEALKVVWRLGKRYDLCTAIWEIGGIQMPFTQIVDPDRVLDDVAAEADRLDKIRGKQADGDQLHLPYWAELWDSAIGIGQHLAGGKVGFPNAKVLDLGCGMGFSGALALRCQMEVTFCDLERPALLFARLNALQSNGRFRTRLLNWQTDRLDERFDLIIGADILYERKQWDFLEPFWKAHLAPGGTVLLGEPGRQTGELFLDWIKNKGWTTTLFSEPVKTRATPIRLVELREQTKTPGT